jgi:hypothetical protein
MTAEDKTPLIKDPILKVTNENCKMGVTNEKSPLLPVTNPTIVVTSAVPDETFQLKKVFDYFFKSI